MQAATWAKKIKGICFWSVKAQKSSDHVIQSLSMCVRVCFNNYAKIIFSDMKIKSRLKQAKQETLNKHTHTGAHAHTKIKWWRHKKHPSRQEINVHWIQKDNRVLIWNPTQHNQNSMHANRFFFALSVGIFYFANNCHIHMKQSLNEKKHL